nr:MAG: nonstructural protein [Microvirus sp.]
MKIFSVYDAKAEAYARPFFLDTIGLALRGFGEACNDPQTELYRNPEDFTLYHIGEFDPASGAITQGHHAPIGKALEYKKSEVARHFVPGTPENKASFAMGIKEAK